MSRRTTTWLAYFVLAMSLAAYAISLAFVARTAVNTPGIQVIDPVDLSVLTFAVIGAFIAVRRPTNAIGWIFGAMGLMWEVFALAKAYAGYLALSAPDSLTALHWILWLPLHVWIPWFGLLLCLFLLFPNGHLLSRRWRPVMWLNGVLIAGLLVTSGTSFMVGSTRLLFPSLLELSGMDVEVRAIDAFAGAITSIFVPLLGAAAAALILRAHRARADERQQLKWFLYASVLCISVFVVEQVFFEFLQSLDPAAQNESELFGGIPPALALAAIPTGAGIAILKYRLYDIDVIIRRTLVYSTLTALIALVYFGSVLFLQQLLRVATGAIQSELVTVLSTLVIAASFVPLRNRIQSVIDRRFYRRKYDAAQTLEAFSMAVRDEVDLNKLSEELLAVVQKTMQPAQVSLWLRKSSQTTPTQEQSR